MADNLFHILKEEAAADAVSDPAAGSYYIEYLTDLIAEKAWSLFQQIEAEGGFLEAIKKGSIQKRIRASADKRAQDVVSGERKILGDRKSTRLNSSHVAISYAVFCMKK